MALYRETATGFVQEYASNPGAGYTLISTMPTTSINARAEWWRDVDKWNQTSAWHPSLGSTAQDPNDNFLQIVFTNDSALVSSDANGNVTDGFNGATTQVRMMRGSQNVTLTEGWSFGLAKSPDVPAFTYTWTGTGTDVLTLQITGFPTDTTSGYIRITATRTGSTTQVKDFKFLKVIKGTDGTNGTNGVRGSRQIVVDGTSWSDAAAWNGIVAQTGTTPVLSDLVTIANAGAGFSASKFYTGGAYDGDWVTPNAYINGNLLVTGTVGADRISAGTIGAYTITLGGASSIIQSTNYVAGTSGWRIKGDGVGEFQNVTVRGSLNASDLTAGTLNISRIADTSITSAKISSLSANKLTAGTIDANTITVSNLHADQLTVGTINGVQITGGAISGSVQIVESGTAKYFGNYLTQLFTTLTLPTGSVSRQAVLINANIGLYNTYGLDGFYIDDTAAYIKDPSYAINKYPMKCSIYIYKNGSQLTVRFIEIPFLLRSTIAHIQYIDNAGGTNADYYEIYASCTSYAYGTGSLLTAWSGCFNIIELKR